MLPIKIQRISHQTELSPQGGVRKLVRIDFMVGLDGPFNKSFPEDGFDQAAALTEIQKFAESLEQLRAQTAPPA